MPQEFTLDDFKRQLDQLQSLGGMKNLLDRVPGMSSTAFDGEDPDAALSRIRKIIDAMSEEERRDPDMIDSSRRSQIAESSGTQANDVEEFLAQFNQVRLLLRQMKE